MTSPFKIEGLVFHPVVRLPKNYEVYDFSKGYDSERMRNSIYGIGRYAEKRPGMYETDLFAPESDSRRDIHMGVDLAAPVGSEVHAFYDGEIFMTGINPAAGDYGGTVITLHILGGVRVWALHGHLSHASAQGKKPGDRMRAGDVIGWLGEEHENGGWNPHVHFQLALVEPQTCDMPGVVNQKDLKRALEIYPDPRLVLGPVY